MTARLAVAAGLGAIFGPATALADTLADAIASAYQTNPSLEAQRAQQQGLDESYVQARSAWRPTVQLEASAGYSRQPQSDPIFGTQNVTTNVGALAVNVTQNLYSGGRTLNAVKAAKSDVLAGREGLRSVEAQVLGAVISAYVQVVFSTEALAIRHRDLQNLEGQLSEVTARLKVGDATRTDLAQTQAQVAGSQQLLASAEAQLQSDRVAYATLVGAPPGALQPPPHLPGLPPTLDEAFTRAEANNPDLEKARQDEAASAARVAEARAARRPTVSVQGSYGYLGQISPLVPKNYISEYGVSAVLTQPLYAGGAINSGVRQAMDRNTVDRITIEASRRAVVQAVSQAWNAWLTTTGNITTAQGQVAAAQAAADGMKIEYRSGQRSALDVLIAQQTLRDAEITLAQAQRDEVVAEASVLAAEGRLEAATLLADVSVYDPAKTLKQNSFNSALPTDPVFEAIDHVAAPPSTNHQAPPAPPPPAESPALRTPAAPPNDAGLATSWPGAQAAGLRTR
jgi:outer membrane protein